ncbi:tyrosine-type recombinase/integrase [Sphingomonas rubra]|uniref:Integrase n=1 Tax=Sphingomonas rubra TaxID=634430 RepID=A0A1I5RWB9_9SPHN|nr:integrase arm-type DNA-binding domain-containing protein [Sphingomonas rubra]SFP62541.1 Integrase [Sphingomonas rubra]
MALTAAEVKNAKPGDRDYKLGDAGGLYLFVTAKGAKSWRMKYRFAGKEKRLTFGLYPEVSLAEARTQRDEARRLLRENKDPLLEERRREAAAVAAAGATFETLARAWHEDEKARWSEGQAKLVLRALVRDIFPALGKLPIRDIDGPMILVELRKIEKRKAIETAKRVRGYVSAVFERAIGEHHVEVNPAAKVGKSLKKTPVGSKQPAITDLTELRDMQKAIDRSTSNATTKLASRLLALTALRVGVLRTGTWDEIGGIDWADPGAPTPDAVWRIAADRMKLEVQDKGDAAFGHDVPLSTQAVEVLRTLHVLTGRYALMFPSDASTRQPMSDAALSSLYKRLLAGKYKGRHVPHGWRSAFSTLMNARAADLDRGGDRMVIDLMLAHVPPGMSSSEYAYNRASYAKQRRELGQAWADMITEGLTDPMVVANIQSP